MIKLFADDAKIYDRINQNQQPSVHSVQPSLNKGVELAKKKVNETRYKTLQNSLYADWHP